MAGKSPAEAVQNYIDPLHKAISCVTNSVLTVSGGYHASSHPHALVLGDGSPVRLSGNPILHLSVLQSYRIVEFEGPHGPWKVTIVSYYYSLEDEDGREILYHWHPSGKVTYPHLHTRAGGNLGGMDLINVHFPTGRVALEDVLRLAISQLSVTPNRSDWLNVLESTQSAYES